MTVDQVAALAEIIEVILVVAALVYVARQLRQNTQMMRVAAASERVQRDADLNFRVSDSREFAGIWLRGNREFDSLDETDRIRLIFFNRTVTVHWQNMLRLHEQDLLPEKDWSELTWLITRLGPRQDTVVDWNMFRDSFDPAFRDFLDSQFTAAEPHG